ncbi:MAG TPA: DUF1553 domain-containing protein [Candidatus Paceibacterota bacterium]|jgi:hypothetical protein|nr:DUF1553 domain-containing protein [Candidatus Paceibacterota bacterium]
MNGRLAALPADDAARGGRIALAGLVMALGACLAVAAPPAGLSPFESPNPPTPRNRIDELVFRKLQQLDIAPAHPCSDAAFVRRAYLDILGTLPTGFEAQDFIRDTKPNKRSALVDRLLGREEFADYWAMKWSDLLRVKAEFPINLWPNAVQCYHRYLRTAVKQNLPYDRFARELLTSSGSNFRVGPVNFYRAMQNKDARGIAQAVALTFMGERAEKWPAERWEGMAAFFQQVGYKSTLEWKEEIVFFDPELWTNNPTRTAVFPDGKKVQLDPQQDPREVFADWLITPTNRWFTRNIANRVWSWLLGRGIIHEPDDIRSDNPPSNPELLAYLEQELIGAGYDLKHLYRLILNSQTYQLSCVPRSEQAAAEAQFAYYPLRRIEAEVLIDALNQITGTTEKYSSPIPEPFTFIPENQRAIALGDGSITSTFLELFGRPARDTGLESERSSRPSAAQRLHLLNSSHIQRKIEQSRMIEYQTQSKKTPREMATGIYLGILSRFPTEAELQKLDDYVQKTKVGNREAAIDLAWALINSAEFLYRH